MVIWKKEVWIACIRVIKDMYKEVMTTDYCEHKVEIQKKKRKKNHITIDVYEESTLNSSFYLDIRHAY